MIERSQKVVTLYTTHASNKMNVNNNWAANSYVDEHAACDGFLRRGECHITTVISRTRNKINCFFISVVSLPT